MENQSKRNGWKISFNAPGTLIFVGLCFLICLIDQIAGGTVNRAAFSVYRTSWADPVMYLRCFTHVLGHSGWDHLLGNMMYLLLLGPVLEEKYGTSNLVFVILATAFITGICNVIFFPDTALLGASGVVFAFILLASMAGMKEHTIPVTFLLVGVLYIGKEVYNAFAVQNNISEMAHIVGGLVGSAMGFALQRIGSGHRKSAQFTGTGR